MFRVPRLLAFRGNASTLRFFTSDSNLKNVVDEMVAYARSNYRENYDQAIDILKSGLGFHQTGIGAGRLYLEQADIEADHSKWTEVSHLCRQAATAASETQPSNPEEVLTMAEIELAASLMGTRAFLTQHKDAEAFQMAQQCIEIARKSFTANDTDNHRWQGLVLSNSTAALVQHAAGELEAAEESFDAALTLIDHVDERTTVHKPRDALVPFALKQAAAFKIAQHQSNEALLLATRAVAAAKEAMNAAVNSVHPLASPRISKETLLDSYIQQAQASIDLESYTDAEKQLENALQIAEDLDQSLPSQRQHVPHIRTALVLLPLAWMYSRTGRVTLAEGLYREIIKILGLDIQNTKTRMARSTTTTMSTTSSTSSTSLGIHSSSSLQSPSSHLPPLNPQSSLSRTSGLYHPSISAIASWRYAQLLSALPKRSAEASSWHELALDFYDDAPLQGIVDPGNIFGSLDVLKGKGTVGYGVVIDVMLRRALLRRPISSFASTS